MSYKLSGLAEAEIQSLQADGIELSPAQILEIEHLCQEVESPHARLNLARGKPVQLTEDVWLWPLTIAAMHWCEDVLPYIRGVTLQAYGLAYAMAEGHKLLPANPAIAAGVIQRWSKTLCCTEAELYEAIEQIHNQAEADPPNDTERKAAASALAMQLTAATGIDPKVWEYQCSIDYCLKMLDAVVSQNRAEDGKGGKYYQAEKRIGLAIKRIRDEHYAKVAEAESNG